MSAQEPQDLSHYSMLELFRLEVENQSAVLTEGLLTLERDPGATHWLATLMRAAHSLKGAARIVDLDAAVHVAHAMEDCFEAAQKEKLLAHERIDALLQGVDLLNRIANTAEPALGTWMSEKQAEIGALLPSLAISADAASDTIPVPSSQHRAPPSEKDSVAADPGGTSETAQPPERLAEPAGPTEVTSRAVRVTADNVTRLLGLAGESLVASRLLDTFARDLLRLKRLQQELTRSLNGLRQSLAERDLDEKVQVPLLEVQHKATYCSQALDERLAEVDVLDRRFAGISRRLYQEVLDCRMRPFADGIQGFPRMVRDVSRTLGKQVKLEVLGESTLIDRDVLERMESSLGHLVRNALDHGIESPADRRRAGKLDEGTVRLEACHRAGTLLIVVADDGRGIDMEALRQAVVQKSLVNPDVAAIMSEPELLDFLFLPGFTMKDAITEISGRGVGLDIVQTMIRDVDGAVRVSSQPGKGMHVQLQLPLTLSVLRTLLVEIAGEPYAFPMARVAGVLKLPRERIESVEGRQHFAFGDHQVGLVSARQVLDLEESQLVSPELQVVVLGESFPRYGLVIDRFLGEQQLVVRTLDPRLGKIKDISAAALMPDQSPVLIVDVEDLTRSIENLVSGGRLAQVRQEGNADTAKPRKRVLVVDDLLTVRELERKLLDSNGYDVEVAVDGMDGWNAVRTGRYDLIVTDVDMPRLDGIELVRWIRKDVRLQSLPVMIVSYKDREEDRRRGLEAGADYYLTKGSFQDTTLLEAVADLIGEAGG